MNKNFTPVSLDGSRDFYSLWQRTPRRSLDYTLPNLWGWQEYYGLEWCFDDARKPGDTGIVKTDYGYHVMYYVSKGEAVFWFEAAKSDLQTERENALEESIREQYPLTETLENAAIFDVQAEDRAAANAAAAEAAASEAATEESGTDASEETAAQEEAGE